MKKQRNSNIELLRIISIILIVVSHYCVHGIGRTTAAHMSFGLNKIILNTLMVGNLGTILFVLISGYYLINSKEVKLKKLFKLLFQIIFYSIVIYGVLVLLDLKTLKIKTLIENMFPITFKMYWFATAYIIIYIFHPFINKLLNNLTRKEHINFIGLLFLIFSVFHFIAKKDYYGNALTQFLMFYSIGAYLSKYPDNILNKNKNNIKAFILSSLCIFVSVIFLSKYNKIFDVFPTYLLERTSPFAIILCTSLFSIFINKKEKNNKFINTIGSLIFGVYLISDNNYLRPIIWEDLLKNIKYINSPYLIIHIIVSSTIVIIVCLLIEFIRSYLIEKPLFKYLDKKFDLLQERILRRE